MGPRLLESNHYVWAALTRRRHDVVILGPGEMLTCLHCYTTAVPRLLKKGHHAITVVLGLVGLGTFALALSWMSTHQKQVSSALGNYPGVQVFALLILGICLLPNISYQLWRARNKYPLCPSCGHHELVSRDSPRGREIASRASGS